MTTIDSQAGAVGFTSELAALLLQNEDNRAESARQQRDLARQVYLQDVQQQVNELNAAADSTMTSALVSSVFTIAGGAAEINGAVSQFKADTTSAGLCPMDYSPKTVELRNVVASETQTAKIWNAVGKASSDLAQPTAAVGQSISEHHQAAAKRFEAARDAAQWQASDASSTIDKANKQVDGFLDTLQGIQRDQNASNNAIIGRI